ncbi:hypothetical protein LJB86_02075 [Deltaproteobacteria bacterium OttesenSCG-928-M10]|nr:hypothetical protein [Deltaproteobacteria bacterium OttesenSCG-928-M10]
MAEKRRFIKTYLNEDEYQAITREARKTGLSNSKYVKRVCLPHEVRSVVDQRAVLALLQCKGDLGRLGGLLKMHLSEPGESQEWHVELRLLLRSIEASHKSMTRQFEELTQTLLQGKKR